MQIKRAISLRIVETGEVASAFVGISYDETGVASQVIEFKGSPAVVWAQAKMFVERDRERLAALPEHPEPPEWLKEPV